ncbi:MAG: hypothetical protein NT069_20240, partial [Planctomycetota bacterium]|nr:hypothetical protein [Planctomycetota bacterium]
MSRLQPELDTRRIPGAPRTARLTVPLILSASASLLLLFFNCLSATAAEPARMIGHWPLAGDVRDHSGHNHHGVNHGADLNATNRQGVVKSAARFDGKGAYIEIPSAATLSTGTDDFTLSAWVEVDAETSDLPGSIASRFDLERRRGFSLGIATNTGVTTNQANFRQLEFGIDNGHDEPQWTDHGRPGEALLIFSLCTHDGSLYAGTCESGATQSGRVFRFVEGTTWVDCGAPDRCNSVSALAAFNGELYAGVSKYRLAGSALAESENPNLGGKVYRYGGNQKWVDCGQIPEAEAIGGLVVFRGKLYATSLYKPAGFYEYQGDKAWKACALPNGKRVEALMVWNDALYAGSYDQGHVFRYDGETWSDLGQVGDATTTQTYSFAAYQGGLYVGTWAGGKVFRYGGGTEWIDCGRLGQEL